jgi:hypothetical protein
MAVVQSQRRKAPREDDPELRGRRVERRAHIVLPGSAEALSGMMRISLLDVSRSGARLEGAGLPAVGKDVVLKCGAIDRLGTIVWAVGERCGVLFDEPISTRELVTLRDVAVAAELAGITPEEEQAAADWMNGLTRFE